MAGHKTVTNSKSERRGNKTSFSSSAQRIEEGGCEVVARIDRALSISAALLAAQRNPQVIAHIVRVIESLQLMRDEVVGANRLISGAGRRAA